MNCWDILINLIEGFILSGFSAYYFNLTNKLKYIFFLSMILTLEITLSNFINQFSWLLIFFEIITLYVSLILKKQSKLSSAFMCIVINVILLCCNGGALFLTSFMFEIPMDQLTMIQNPYEFYVAIIISKLCLSMIAICLCRYKLTLTNNLHLKQWWMFVVIMFTSLLLSIIILEIIMKKILKFNTMMMALMLIMINTVFIILLFYRTNIENERLINITTKISDAKNKERSFKLLETVNRDLEKVMHNSKYFLLTMKNILKTKEYEKIESLVDSEMNEILKLQTLLDTGNLLFDYNFNSNLRKYNLQKRNIKFMISLEKIDFVNSQIFIDFINRILYFIKSDIKDNYISLNMFNTKTHIVIRVIFKKDTGLNEYWRSQLRELNKMIYFIYEIKSYETFIKLSMVIPIKYEQ